MWVNTCKYLLKRISISKKSVSFGADEIEPVDVSQSHTAPHLPALHHLLDVLRPRSPASSVGQVQPPNQSLGRLADIAIALTVGRMQRGSIVQAPL